MKTHPIVLDKERQLRFDNKAIRALDVELTKEYGHSFMFFAGGLSSGELNFDVLVRAIRYGLMHDREQRLSDTRIQELVGRKGVSEFDLWNAVAEAYSDARHGVRVEYDAEDNASEENESDPPDETPRAIGEAPEEYEQ